jgi:hypothetical protein
MIMMNMQAVVDKLVKRLRKRTAIWLNGKGGNRLLFDEVSAKNLSAPTEARGSSGGEL